MNKKLVGYWVTTALFCLVMTADGVASLLRIERQQAIMEVLGYPPYLMTLLGIPSCAVVHRQNCSAHEIKDLRSA